VKLNAHMVRNRALSRRSGASGMGGSVARRGGGPPRGGTV
jgi:hypothetical protein